MNIRLLLHNVFACLVMHQRHCVWQGSDLGAHLLVVAAYQHEHVAAVHDAEQVEQEERQAVVQALG